MCCSVLLFINQNYHFLYDAVILCLSLGVLDSTTRNKRKEYVLRSALITVHDEVGDLADVPDNLEREFNTYWSPEEDEIVKKFYQTEGLKGVKERGVKRTDISIRTRATSLGVNIRSRYSDWEDDIIRKFYPSGGYLAVQEHGVERGSKGIFERARVLKLKTDSWFEPWEDEIIRQFYPSGGSKEVIKTG